MNFFELEIDERLWFTLKEDDCNGRHFILGNPHTFNGRIMGFCTEKKKSFYFSKSEIDEMSVETECWIKGYLCGNEPNPPQMEEGTVDFKSEEYRFWGDSIEIFHETGYWNYSDRVCDDCGKKLMNAWTEFSCKECLAKAKD